jgi:phosphoglucosamine mutase
MVAEEICDSKATLAQLAEPVKVYPQYLKNVRVKDKAAVLADKSVLAALEEVEKLINKNGRALLRQSGTEPVIRVMIESVSEEKCVEYANIIADAIIAGGHVAE